ncbi:TPA: hypothetical protein ACGN81_005157 [Bacillus cereus]
MSMETQRGVGPTFVVDICPGLFLGSDNRFYRERPANSKVYQPLENFVPLSDNVKAILDGQSLQTMDKQVGTQVLDWLNISEKTRDIFSKAAGVISTLSSIVGYVQVAIRILNALGLNLGEDNNQLAQITQRVNDIWKAIKGLDIRVNILEIRESKGKIDTAATLLAEFLGANDPNDQYNRQQLNNYKAELISAIDGLIGDPAYAEVLFDPEDYANTDWYLTYRWLIPAEISAFSGNLPSPSDDVPLVPFYQKEKDKHLWDYRLFAPHIIEAIAVMLPYLKALDPAFRTTGRYKDFLTNVKNELKLFASNMLHCIQWTRDYDPFGDQYSAPMADGWPVGAVDTCSGASAYDPDWKDLSWYPNPNDPLHLTSLLNVEESLKRAKEQRDQALLAVYQSSGLPYLQLIIGQIEHLLTPPTSAEGSETVRMTVTKEGTNEMIGRESRCVEPDIACTDRKCWEASVYKSSRQISVLATTQPIEFREGYIIPYRYYLESYTEDNNDAPYQLIQRIELSESQGTATLNALCFDWEVKSCNPDIGCLERVKLPDWRQLQTGPAVVYHNLLKSQGIKFDSNNFSTLEDSPGIAVNFRVEQIQIDYELIKGNGNTTIHLRNRPGEASFRSVRLVVDELPLNAEGSRPIQTWSDVSMNGIEYYLPEAYFKYREDCILRSLLLLEEIKNRARLKQVPVPHWDQWKYPKAADYVRWVAREYPQVIEGIQGLERYLR